MHLGAEDFEDFLGEMWLGVHEGGFLFEFPGGSITYTQEGTERRGPWHPGLLHDSVTLGYAA